MEWPLLASFLAPLALSAIFTACFLRLAPRLGLIDMPSERKFHKRPTPTGAGLALFAAVALSAVLLASSGITDGAGWNVQFLLGALIVFFGLIDDHHSLPWQARLLVQVLTAFIAVNYATPNAEWEFVAFGTFWVVILINAINFVDNMDGLCAGITWIVAACLALAEYKAFGTRSAVLVTGPSALGTPHLLMLMGALTGFLWFNRPPARVFMGDAGSTFLGFFIAVATLPLFLDVDEKSHLSDDWVAPVCMMALPIYDLVSVAVLRVWHRRGLFVSDKNNLSHRLVELGLSPTIAVCLLWLLALAGGVGGLVLYQVPHPAKAIPAGLQLACWWAALPVTEYVAWRRMAG
jgi:UDP-GlcNAc:undecaprenyl-phosphate GlcNAc-1-phosphate transferase